MKQFLTIFMLCICLSACGEKPVVEPAPLRLNAPKKVEVERYGETGVKVTWVDANENEKGYIIYLSEFKNADQPKVVGRTGANAKSFTIKGGIEVNTKYYVGVQAEASDKEYNSKIVNVLYEIQESELPKGSIMSVKSLSSGIGVSFRFANIASRATYGVCWSSDGKPSVNGPHQVSAAPQQGVEYFQMISNALLDYGKTYNICAYAIANGKIYYSPAVKASLGEEPQPIKLDWKKLSTPGLPAEIEVYETVSELNSRAFHAWYAIADVSSGKVKFKTLLPSSAATVDAQAAKAKGCCVLINGGYFYAGKGVGISVVAGETKGTITNVRGSLRKDDPEYNVRYNIARGVFGVDSEACPKVYWAAAPSSGMAWYYDRPVPNVVGLVGYPEPDADIPSTAVNWFPEYAQSAGPVLLKDGKCPVDFTPTQDGGEYYYSNHEVMPYDIYGPSMIPDRTAVGYTADGKIVLFVCDGRISSSRGAKLTELAMILKGIGCVEALNLDGGGSTGIVVDGKHLNDMSSGNRAVVSTMGFFK